MKSITLSILCSFMLAFGATAQTKAVQKVVISTPTIQCDMCKNKIEKSLARYDGINSVVVNVKKKTATVVYITDRTNEEQIKTHIANLGYDAGDVTAEEGAYKKLPACCKKPVNTQ